MFIQQLNEIKKKVNEKKRLEKKLKIKKSSKIEQLESEIEELKKEVDELILLTLKNYKVIEITNDTNSKKIDPKYLKKENGRTFLYVYLFFIEKVYYEGEKTENVIAQIQLAGINITGESILEIIRRVSKEIGEEKGNDKANELIGLYNSHV